MARKMFAMLPCFSRHFSVQAFSITNSLFGRRCVSFKFRLQMNSFPSRKRSMSSRLFFGNTIVIERAQKMRRPFVGMRKTLDRSEAEESSSFTYLGLGLLAHSSSTPVTISLSVHAAGHAHQETNDCIVCS